MSKVLLWVIYIGNSILVHKYISKKVDGEQAPNPIMIIYYLGNAHIHI